MSKLPYTELLDPGYKEVDQTVAGQQFIAYMKGWKDAAANLPSDAVAGLQLVNAKNRALRDAYNSGYAHGTSSRNTATRLAAHRFRYKPTAV